MVPDFLVISFFPAALLLLCVTNGFITVSLLCVCFIFIFATVNGLKMLSITALPSVNLPSKPAEHCFPSESRLWNVINTCCAKFDDSFADDNEKITEDSNAQDENACIAPIASVVACELQPIHLIEHEVRKVQSLMNNIMLECLKSRGKLSLCRAFQSVLTELSSGEIEPSACNRSGLSGLIETESQLMAFAGVTFSQLSCLTELLLRIEGDYNQCPSLSMKERVILTLAKLRTNLHFEALCIFLGVSRAIVEQYFRSTIRLLALVLKPCIPWLSGEDNLMSIPECLSQVRDVRLILDCIEIPVDSPDCLRCLNQMYSHFQKLLSVKILVGVSPLGLITFLSKCYGNQATCERVFIESNLVQDKKLEPFRDAVIVDRSLRIENYCEQNNINISFLMNMSERRQKNPSHAKYYAEIARARATLQTVLRRMLGYDILSGRLAWSLVPHFDDICTVISGLVNLNSSIISKDRPGTTVKECAC